MDLSRCVVSPNRIDLLRNAVEDDVAARRICSSKSVIEVASDYIDRKRYRLVTGKTKHSLLVVVIVDRRALVRTGVFVSRSTRKLADWVFQAAQMNAARMLVGCEETDLLLALACLSVDEDAPVFYEQWEVRRAFPEEVVRDLSRCRLIFAGGLKDRVQHSHSVPLPDTMDREHAHFSLLEQYAQEHGISVDDVDPIGAHFVFGIENWNKYNQPGAYMRLPRAKRVALANWIAISFDHAASCRTCPGCSYELKHWFGGEHPPSIDAWEFYQPFYVTNGQFKGAMIANGFFPTDPWSTYPVYRIKWKPRIRYQIQMRHAVQRARWTEQSFGAPSAF